MSSVYGMAATILGFFFIGVMLDNRFGGGKGVIVIASIVIAIISVFYQAYRALREIKGPDGIKKP